MVCCWTPCIFIQLQVNTFRNTNLKNVLPSYSYIVMCPFKDYHKGTIEKMLEAKQAMWRTGVTVDREIFAVKKFSPVA